MWAHTSLTQAQGSGACAQELVDPIIALSLRCAVCGMREQCLDRISACENFCSPRRTFTAKSDRDACGSSASISMMMIVYIALAFAPTPRTQAKAQRPLLRPLIVSAAESTSNGDSARDSLDAPLAVRSSDEMKLPTVSRPFVVRLVACLCLFGVASPHLASRFAYVAVGVSLGFGSTKFIRVAASPDARDRLAAFAAQLQVRARLRALLLRVDPSLAGDEINPVTLRGGPFSRDKKKQSRGIGPPSWAQPMNPTQHPTVSVLEEQGRLVREDAERGMTERRTERRVRSVGTSTASSSASAEAEAESERERAIIEKKARERERLAEQARIAEAENLAWAVREAAWARERERALEAAAAQQPFPQQPFPQQPAPPSQSMPAEQFRTEGWPPLQ